MAVDRADFVDRMQDDGVPTRLRMRIRNVRSIA